MNKLFFLLLLLPGLRATAQSWLAADHVWTYNASGGFIGINLNFTLAIGIDTVINGQTCKKMSVNAPGFLLAADRFAYASGNRVYAYQSSANAFVQLYDFDLGPGAEVQVPLLYSPGGQFAYRIQAVDTVLAGGVLRKRQQAVLLSNGAPTGILFDILEGIGMAGRPFQSAQPQCSYFFLDESFCQSVVDGFDIKFLCFSDSGGLFSPYGVNCSVATAEPATAAGRIMIRPNPAGDFLQPLPVDLPGPALRTRLFDAHGRLIRTMDGLPESIPVADLPAGVYLLQVELERGQSVAARFVRRGDF